MSWRDAIIANLPPGNADDEPADLRRDILDELSDHLECAMKRESLRHEDDAAARRAVLNRFGNPAAIARRLWLDAMKERIMNQRIVIGTNIVLAVIVIAMFIIVLVSMRQNQQFQAALVERLAEIAAPAAEAPEQAATVMPVAADAGAMSWPSARIRIEGGNPPFRLQLSGELYNPGERLNISRTAEDGEMVVGPMRPGRYTLNTTDNHGARYSRSVVVPPGGEHVVTIRAPDWEPQPTETRVRLDMPEDLAERLGIIMIIENASGVVAGPGQPWTPEYLRLAIGADGRVARFDSSPLSPNGIIGAHRESRRPSRTGPPQTVYRFDPDDLGLDERVTLDASLYYVASSASLLFPMPTEDRSGIVYHQIRMQDEVRIDPEDIATGEVRISLGLTEEAVAHLRSALDEREDECRALGARRAGDRENMCYILHGGAVGPADREVGYRLLVVLPGGDGSADFREFVSSIQGNALPRRGWLVAQAVAPVWDADQPDQVVWPTQGLPWPTMEFATEEFIAAIIDDVAEQYPIDENHIYALGWASGGPPAYAAAMQEETKLRGAFIAMSVFHPDQYPPTEHAIDRSFYILHSPDDFIAMRFPEQARDALAEAGARVQLDTYEGGHGWHGDVYGQIRRGIEWLEEGSR